MKKLVVILMVCGMISCLAACGNSQSSSDAGGENTASVSNADEASQEGETEPSKSTEQSSGAKDALVAYFAYGENIGDTSDMSVDAIASASLGQTSNTEGNLQLMAQVIQDSKGADVFHIVVEEPYDPEYDVMHDRAIEEQDEDIKPALTDKVDNIGQYNVVYLGMPVWSGSLPQPVVTFLTENDLSGKTIVPFGIHLGSRFGSMLDQIEDLCPGATLAEGFTIDADTENDEVRSEFEEWLDKLELD